MKKENQLLSRIVKLVTGKEDTTTKADVIDETLKTDQELVIEVASEELDVLKAQVEALTADLGEKLEAANGALAEMTAKFEEAQAQLSAIAAEKAQMVTDALAAKLAARKEKVVAAIGTEKADGLMLATEGLDDTAFEAVVSALAGSVAAEAASPLFKEVGVTAEADAAKVVEESAEMKLLKKQYGAN